MDARLRDKYRLRAGPDRDLSRDIERRHRAGGFHIALVHHLGPESILRDDIGLLEPQLHVALHKGGVGTNVALPNGIEDLRIAGEVLVDNNRPFLHGQQRIKNRRQLFVLHRDQPYGLLRRIPVHRCNCCDRLVNMPYHPLGQDWLVKDKGAHSCFRQIGARDHCLHSRQTLGL